MVDLGNCSSSRLTIVTCVALAGQGCHLCGVDEHGQGAVVRAFHHGVVERELDRAPVVLLAPHRGKLSVGAVGDADGGGSVLRPEPQEEEGKKAEAGHFEDPPCSTAVLQY